MNPFHWFLWKKREIPHHNIRINPGGAFIGLKTEIAMALVRLTKHQQDLLCEIWENMPSALKEQLTRKSVRNVEIDSKDVSEAVRIILARRAGILCKARSRRFDALATALK